jgi:hypothetical protein
VQVKVRMGEDVIDLRDLPPQLKREADERKVFDALAERATSGEVLTSQEKASLVAGVVSEEARLLSGKGPRCTDVRRLEKQAQAAGTMVDVAGLTAASTRRLLAELDDLEQRTAAVLGETPVVPHRARNLLFTNELLDYRSSRGELTVDKATLERIAQNWLLLSAATGDDLSTRFQQLARTDNPMLADVGKEMLRELESAGTPEGLFLRGSKRALEKLAVQRAALG